MANQLYPVLDIATVDTLPATLIVVDFPQDFLFDFDTGEFVTDGRNAVVMADGWTAWTQWCMKQCQMQRFSLLAYNTDVGVEYDLVNSQNTNAEKTSMLQQSISDALLIDKRTLSVSDFVATWDSDSVYVSLTITPVQGQNFKAKTIMNL